MLLKSLLFAAFSAGSVLTPRASNNSSTFVYQNNGADVVLSVRAVASTGDLWFRLSAPGVYDWVAFGVGQQMKGALTLVAYPTKNGSALQLSPRLSTGHTEPTYNSAIKATKVYVSDDPSANHIDPNTAGTGGTYTISGVCYNCTGWSKPPLDLTSTNAPFMFALGPVDDGTNTRWSDRPDAPLRRHSVFGQFSVDMTRATVQSADGILVPTTSNVTEGVTAAKIGYTPHDYGSAFHAILLCLAIGIVLPFDSILVWFFRKTLLHYVFQGLNLVLVTVGLGLGFWVSTWFVRSRNFSSAHQIIGYLTIVVILAQIPVGLVWRMHRLKAEEPQRWVKMSHQVLTGLFWLLAVADVGLGFNLALQPGFNKIWTPLIIAVFIVCLIASGMRACLAGHLTDRAKAVRLEQETADAYKRAHEDQLQAQHGLPQYSGDYGAPGPYANGGDVELQHYGGQKQAGVQYSSVQVPGSY